MKKPLLIITTNALNQPPNIKQEEKKKNVK
jgi:hypothetical protein